MGIQAGDTWPLYYVCWEEAQSNEQDQTEPEPFDKAFETFKEKVKELQEKGIVVSWIQIILRDY